MTAPCKLCTCKKCNGIGIKFKRNGKKKSCWWAKFDLKQKDRPRRERGRGKRDSSSSSSDWINPKYLYNYLKTN